MRHFILFAVLIGVARLIPDATDCAAEVTTSKSMPAPGANIWESRNPSVAWKDFPDREGFDRLLKNCTIRDIMRIYKKPSTFKAAFDGYECCGNDAILAACWIDKPYSGSRFFRDKTGQMWQKPWRMIEYATDDEGVLPTPRTTILGDENEEIPDEWQREFLAQWLYCCVHPPKGWCGPRYIWSSPDDKATLCGSCIANAVSREDVESGRYQGGETCVNGQCGRNK